MATYFHGNSEIQGADGLQTLVLMNPGYVQYSDAPAQQTGNYVFLNSAANSLSSPTLPHAPPPHTQQFVGFPLASPTSHQDPNSQSMQAQAQAQHELSAMHGFAPRIQYNLWNSIDPSAEARGTPRAQQGLSLSLSSQQPGFGSFRGEGEVVPSQAISGGSPSSASGVTNGVSGMQSVLMSSKYLKAAQELLDEVVNVGNNGIKADSSKKSNKTVQESSAAAAAASGDGSVTAEGSGKNSSELSTVERQEIQMKKAKLITMLDEVEQRYRQYHHQMQIVTSSFEQVAGTGSAKTYTALALETISKQFRCLKDAITSQIRAANKTLGEEDSNGGKIEGSRLKFVDHHLRQQRALQQLGMIQHNAWRPQRGLPERSVSVLRAWLFEHFLHPYPKDSDKHMLAKQTGLTRSQVSNWFINARVRLWKPMVEEMYLEELKEQEQNGSEDKTTLSKGDNKEDSTSMSEEKRENRSKRSINQDSPSMTQSASPMGANARNPSVFSLMGSSELEGITQRSPKKARNADMLHSPPSMGNDVKPEETHNNINMFSMKFGGNERQARDEYSTMTGGGPANFIGGFGQYPIGEIGRFDTSDQQYTPRFSGNGVSLTLGLPHCENNLSLSGTNQSFLQNQNISQLGRRVDQLAEPSDQFGHVIATSTPHSSSAYDSINIQNRKRFAAQLLPDFVA